MKSNEGIQGEIAELRAEFEPPYSHYVDSTFKDYTFVHEFPYVRSAIVSLWLGEETNWSKAELADQLEQDFLLQSVEMTTAQVNRALEWEYHNINGDTMHDIKRDISYLMHPLVAYTAGSMFGPESGHSKVAQPLFTLSQVEGQADTPLAILSIDRNSSDKGPKISSIHKLESEAKEKVRAKYMKEMIDAASKHNIEPTTFRHYGARFLFLGVFNGLITKEDLGHLPQIGPLKDVKVGDRFSSEEAKQTLKETSKAGEYYHKYFHIYKLYRDGYVSLNDCLLFLLEYRETLHDYIISEGLKAELTGDKTIDAAIIESKPILSKRAFDQAYRVGAITLEEYVSILSRYYKLDWTVAMEDIIEQSKYLQTDQLIPLCRHYFQEGAVNIADIDPFIKAPRSDLIQA